VIAVNNGGWDRPFVATTFLRSGEEFRSRAFLQLRRVLFLFWAEGLGIR
jgi:hypothetical protein